MKSTYNMKNLKLYETNKGNTIKRKVLRCNFLKLLTFLSLYAIMQFSGRCIYGYKTI